MGHGKSIFQIISLNTLVDVIRVPKHLFQVNSEHLHADRGDILFELILEKILKLIIIIIIITLKNRKNLSFLMGCGKALPAISWTHKCECILEI